MIIKPCSTNRINSLIIKEGRFNIGHTIVIIGVWDNVRDCIIFDTEIKRYLKSNKYDVVDYSYLHDARGQFQLVYETKKSTKYITRLNRKLNKIYKEIIGGNK